MTQRTYYTTGERIKLLRGEHGNIGVHYQAPPPQAQWIGRIIAVSRGEFGEGCWALNAW